MKKCSYCGRQNDEGAAYCRECGTTLAETFEAPRQPRPRLSIFGDLSVGVGLVTSGVALIISLQFFMVARGESVRAMGWAGLVFLLASCGLMIGVPCGVVGMSSPRRWWALVGIVLNLAPWPISVAMLQLAAAVKGFNLSP